MSASGGWFQEPAANASLSGCCCIWIKLLLRCEITSKAVWWLMCPCRDSIRQCSPRRGPTSNGTQSEPTDPIKKQLRILVDAWFVSIYTAVDTKRERQVRDICNGDRWVVNLRKADHQVMFGSNRLRWLFWRNACMQSYKFPALQTESLVFG